MRRVPLRLKLTLAFTGVMAVLLAVAGIALSVLVASNLDSTINDGLQARAGDQAAVLVVTGRASSDRLERSGEQYVQVFQDGRLSAWTQGAGSSPLLTRAEVESAATRPLIAEHKVRNAHVRVYARPAGRFVVLVGESLAQREKALDSLRALLIIGGPLALLIASLVGYALAAAALRPVERMRRRAAAVTAAETSERLPVPP